MVATVAGNVNSGCTSSCSANHNSNSSPMMDFPEITMINSRLNLNRNTSSPKSLYHYSRNVADYAASKSMTASLIFGAVMSLTACAVVTSILVFAFSCEILLALVIGAGVGASLLLIMLMILIVQAISKAYVLKDIEKLHSEKKETQSEDKKPAFTPKEAALDKHAIYEKDGRYLTIYESSEYYNPRTGKTGHAHIRLDNKEIYVCQSHYADGITTVSPELEKQIECWLNGGNSQLNHRHYTQCGCYFEQMETGQTLFFSADGRQGGSSDCAFTPKQHHQLLGKCHSYA